MKHCSTVPYPKFLQKEVPEDPPTSPSITAKTQSDKNFEQMSKFDQTPKKTGEEEIKQSPKYDITEDEFALFSCVLKGRINIPAFVREHFKSISTLQPTAPAILERLTLKLDPPKKKKLSTKTLVFDLDNTLVYVVTSQTYAKMNLPKNMDVRQVTYTDQKEGKPLQLNIIVRPFALEMLQQLSSYYEIIVFTAASKAYGDVVLNSIDSAGTLIDHRLYRENCIKEGNTYIKDLRIINRDLSSMIIVDDNISSFSNQLGNGIFISPFNGNATDAELGVLWIFLRQIIGTNDVRVPIAAKYNLPFLYRIFVKSLIPSNHS